MSRVFLSCGEASGDLYAAALVRELRALDPSVITEGFGGPRLEAAGTRLIGDYRGISVTGLVEVLRLLPKTWRMYRRLVAEAARTRPDVFVAIDFPDFNFRLGASLKALGIPVVYYISPQLWAWRPGRLNTLKRFVDRMLVIFPFEEPLYRQAGVPVEFVGHPLRELLEPVPPRADFLAAAGLAPDAPTVALLPGSRPNELHRLMETLVAAARLMAERRPRLQFIVARAPRLDDQWFAPVEEARGRGLRIALVEGATDAALAASDVVITASGTATVQTALHDRPMVIVYRLDPLTYRLGKPFVKVDTYGMVNLVAGRRVVPELIQDGCTPETIAAEASRFLDDEAYAAATRAGLAEVRQRLGEDGASRRAARAVLQVATSRA